MTKNKLAIIGGSGLYEIEGFIVDFFSKDKVNKLSNGFEILNIDKFEQENVFSKDEYRDSVSKLFESILQWQKDAEDSADLPDLGNI